MGFSFGLMVWLPMAAQHSSSTGFFCENFFLFASLYAVLLLGEVLFWNSFGFDRQAAQAYWVFPVPMKKVVISKNITALFLLLLEITTLLVVCKAIRLSIPWSKVAEAYAVTILFAVFLTATGNMASAYYPRAVDPANSWRRAHAGATQVLLVLMYPLIAFPISFAYLARYAFDTTLAFYATLAVGFLIAAIYYYVALDTALETLDQRREAILQALSESSSPLNG